MSAGGDLSTPLVREEPEMARHSVVHAHHARGGGRRRTLSQQAVDLLGGDQDPNFTPAPDKDHVLRRRSIVSLQNEGGEQRANWGSKAEFLLALVGYAVGLGNVWRFPYLCYSNGGGAFLIPYFTMLLVLGIPMFLLELGIGQYYQQSCVHVWQQIHPTLFRGLGWASSITSFIVAIYYNVIIAWTLYYFAISFKSPVPWKDDSEKYWFDDALQRASTISHPGDVVGHLAGALFVAWLFIFVAILKGVETSGKVVYFTATFPYFVLIILFIKGLTLPGAGEGIKYYLTPDFSKLGEFKVWVAATIQIFYSLGVGWGGLVTYASYNNKKNDFVRDALFVPVCNCLTSLFAGFVAFSIIGFMAHETKQDVEDVVSQGSGLAFIVYPAALAKFGGGGGSSAFSVMFFLMLFCLGVDSQLAMVETVLTTIVDARLFPNTPKQVISGAICLVSFLLGLLYVSQAGEFWVTLTDNYAALLSLLIVNGIECVAVSQFLGCAQFYKMTEEMSGRKLHAYYRIAWTYACPLLTFTMAILSVVLYDPGCMVSDDDGGCLRKWPQWSVAIGWILAVGCTLPVAPFPVKLAQYLYGEHTSGRLFSQKPRRSSML